MGDQICELPTSDPSVYLWETTLGLTHAVQVSVKKPALSRQVGLPQTMPFSHCLVNNPISLTKQSSFSEWSYQPHIFVGGAGAGSGCFGIKGILRISLLPLAKLALEPQICQQDLPILVSIYVGRPPSLLLWLSCHHVAEGQRAWPPSSPGP